MITLEQVKAQLALTADDDDGLLTDLIARADAWALRFADEDADPAAPDMDQAKLLLIQHWFEPDDKTPMDDFFGVPLAVIASIGPFRTPTLA